LPGLQRRPGPGCCRHVPPASRSSRRGSTPAMHPPDCRRAQPRHARPTSGLSSWPRGRWVVRMRQSFCEPSSPDPRTDPMPLRRVPAGDSYRP
jgi:hypothetical protein